MRKNKIIEKYLEQIKNKSEVHVSMREDGFLDFICGIDSINYNPAYVPFLYEALSDEEYPHKIIIGAYGSGKTSAIVNTVLRDSVLMPCGDDGIRRSRFAFIRNTAGQLETTTLNTWLFWTRGLPTPQRLKKPQLTYTYKFNDSRGTIILEVLFLALDRDYDISKLDSLELTGAFFNELRHIPHKIFDTVLSRIGRYPSKIEFMDRFNSDFADCSDDEKELIFSKWKPYTPRIYADTNAPKNGHWIAELDKGEHRKLKIYHQPPALLINEKGDYEINKEADNLAFVGEEYYLDMIDRGHEFVKVYARGEYGTIVDGKPVYPNYNDDIHSIDTLDIVEDATLYIGCDYGITCPAVIIAQLYKAQIRFVKEFIGEYESIKSLWESAVIPYLNTHCRGLPLEIIGDPADTSAGSQQLKDLGLEPTKSITNKIEARISTMVNVLNTLVGGRPRLVVSKKGCPILREGFLGEYHFRRLRVVGDEKYVDEPNKTHPYSDIHDAAQYVVIRICDELQIPLMPFSIPDNSNESRSKITGY